MKRSLAAILIENSKATKKVDGEMGVPSYDNISTPTNKVTGPKEVSAKNLGDRPGGNKRTKQVEGPKSKERRPMSEDESLDEDLGSDDHTIPTRGSITNQKKAKRLRKQSKAGRGIVNPKASTKSTEKHSWNKALGEGLGDNPDSAASMPFSKASNKDEGMKTPKVAKGKAVARGAKIGTIGDNKKNPANIGKTRKLPKGYAGGERVEVAKIKESLDDLADFLGVDVEIEESNYPDDFNQGAFDSAYGTDSDDAAYEEAMDNMVYEVGQFLSQEGPDYIADYKKYMNHEDDAYRLENLTGLVEGVIETAIEAIRGEGDFEVDTDKLKPMVEKFLKEQGVAERDIPAAFEEYMSEGVIGEDYISNRSESGSVDDVEYALEKKGFQRMGGGLTGGELNYRNQNGDVVTISVHMMNPKKMVGWKASIGGKTMKGSDAAELNSNLRGRSAGPGADNPLLRGLDKNNRQKKGGMIRRGMNRMMGRESEAMDEMSSGGAVASGGIASGGGNRPQSQLFASDDVEEAHGTSKAFLAYSRAIDQSEGKAFASLERSIRKDSRLTHDEKAELDSMWSRKQQQTRPAMENDKQMKGEDPCWDGYEMVGKKKKNGKEVPNCVPESNQSFGRWSGRRK